MLDDFELIHSYSRADAIRDGVLVDLMQGELGQLVKEAGFRWPVAMTAEAFQQYVQLTPSAELAGQDIKGRLWDILVCLRLAIRKADSEVQEVLFTFYCSVENVAPRRSQLKSVIGLDDDGQAPVLTLMLPHED